MLRRNRGKCNILVKAVDFYRVIVDFRAIRVAKDTVKFLMTNQHLTLFIINARNKAGGGSMTGFLG